MAERARVVVIGGGVGGASIAYHLAEAGCTDVVLVERSELTSGSTFHSAGLVGQLRSSLPLTRMMMHSVDVYRRLALANEFRWINLPSLVIALTLAHLATPQYALVATENRVLVLRKNLGSKTVKEVSSSFDRGSCSVTTQIRTSGIKMKTRFGDSPRSYTAPTFLAADVEAFEAALHPFSAQKGRGWGAVEQVPPTSGPTAYHQLHTNGIERSARAEGDFSGQ